MRRLGSWSIVDADLQTWPHFEANGGVVDHVTRSLPRDYPIFRRMRPGDQYPEAHRHALALFNARVARLRRSGVRIRKGSDKYVELRRSIVPPYDPGKFPNQSRKMEPDRPARTLMAHLGHAAPRQLLETNRNGADWRVKRGKRLKPTIDRQA